MTASQLPPPPQPPAQAPASGSSTKRIAVVATLLIVIAGLATAAGLVLVNRGADDVADDAQYVSIESTTTEPVFEPAFAAGNDPFYPLSEQLVSFQAEAEDEISRRLAEIRIDPEPGEEVSVPVFNVEELEENVKTGLYGGTAENTCDPERLISFLIANPEIGEAWAAVQGIPFNQIPAYIRSLEVRVLAADLEVVNHGYDPITKTAYPIVSILAAGTAVLVDEDGDVRTRCYCGNPIVPKPPVTYMPPRCIVWGQAVLVSPGGGTYRENAPRDVVLTGKETVLGGGGLWVEVKWGDANDQRGWVRNDWLRRHYCPPPHVDYECPGPGEVAVYANDRTTIVGYVNGTLNLHDGPTEIYAPIDPVGGAGAETIVDGFLLIHFERVGPSNSAWVNTADLNQDADDCHYIPQCVRINNPVRERPGGIVLGGGYTGGPQYIDYTGNFAPEGRQFTEIRLLDHGSIEGWVAPLWVTNLDPQECDNKPIYSCVEYGVFYRSATEALPMHYGHLNNAEVLIKNTTPTNGRILIDVAPGGPEAWIDQGDLQGGWNECKPVPECYATSGPAFAIYPDGGAVLAADATPRILNLVGKIVDSDAPGVPDAFTRIEDPGTGMRYWIQTGPVVTHLHALPPYKCEPTPPECPQPGQPGDDDRVTVALNVQGPMRFGIIVNPDADTQPPTNPDRPEYPNTECCVEALFQIKNLAGPPSARTAPRNVVVVGFDGTWYTTAFGDHFQASHVVGGEACRPECPPPNDRNPGYDPATAEDGIAYYVTETVVYQPGGLPGGDQGDCCVDALYSAPGVGGNLITEPTYVTVVGGPEYQLLDDWYHTDGGFSFPSGARVADSECDRDISCPDANPGQFGGEEYNFTTAGEVNAKFIYGPQQVATCCIGSYIGYGGPDMLPPAIAVDAIGFYEVAVVEVSDDGQWFKLDSGFWVSADAFVDPALCTSDDGECPTSSLVLNTEVVVAVSYSCCIDADGPTLVPLDFLTGGETFLPAADCQEDTECPHNSTVVDVYCCVQLPDGSVELVHVDELDPNVEYVFLGPDRCRTTECPQIPPTGDNEFPSASTDPQNPTICCVTTDGFNFQAELTGARREIGQPGSNVWEYEIEPGDLWVAEGDFIDADLCFEPQQADPPPLVPPVPTTPPVPADPCAGLGGDTDGDGVCDARDNCATVFNTGQADSDGDRIGDACDEPDTDPCLFFGGDTDGDGVCDETDNCLRAPNQGQADTDNDGLGNVCDPTPEGDPCEDRRGDTDGDGVCDIDDNCRQTVNPQQGDADQDGVGDLCDDTPKGDPCANQGGDIDNDGICDQQDECTSPDADRDGHQDDCDSCPGVNNPEQFPLPFQDGKSCVPALGTADPGSGTTAIPTQCLIRQCTAEELLGFSN